ncbi:MAG TPA: hypothetical protein VNT26_15935 [Candidatus Sulfotelmatobacter sp.]|nr:hypothetical protein [Candidatus Sulfotelmatobacter sp.]HWI64549.1 hypothetical protein [Symbiobacteriaceae bacterium]
MKRLLVALTVVALLAVFAVPALAQQARPIDPGATYSAGVRKTNK